MRSFVLDYNHLFSNTAYLSAIYQVVPFQILGVPGINLKYTTYIYFMTLLILCWLSARKKIFWGGGGWGGWQKKYVTVF